MIISLGLETDVCVAALLGWDKLTEEETTETTISYQNQTL